MSKYKIQKNAIIIESINTTMVVKTVHNNVYGIVIYETDTRPYGTYGKIHDLSIDKKPNFIDDILSSGVKIDNLHVIIDVIDTMFENGDLLNIAMYVLSNKASTESRSFNNRLNTLKTRIQQVINYES